MGRGWEGGNKGEGWESSVILSTIKNNEKKRRLN